MSLPAPLDQSNRMRGGSDVSESVEYQSVAVLGTIRNSVDVFVNQFVFSGNWKPNKDVSIYKIILSSEFTFVEDSGLSGAMSGVFRFAAEADLTANPLGSFFTQNTNPDNAGQSICMHQPILIHRANGLVGTTFSKTTAIGWLPYEGFKLRSTEQLVLCISNAHNRNNIVRPSMVVHFRVDQLLPPPRK